MTFSAEQAERYSRHFVLREIGVEGQKRLLAAKVLVIGAGGLGSGALPYLAAAGVGTIGVVDCDRVEPSNLQRQVIHRTDRVGMEKALSAKQTLEALNPDVTVEARSLRVTPDNILDLIAPYDFIIDGTDRFETKFLINDACVLSRKPYSHAGVVRFGGQAMTYVPDRGPCLRCLLERVPPKTEYCSQVGVLGSVTGILGNIQATEAVKYVLGIGELLTGRLLLVDGLAMSMRDVALGPARTDCPVCGEHPVISSLAANRREYETGSLAAP